MVRPANCGGEAEASPYKHRGEAEASPYKLGGEPGGSPYERTAARRLAMPSKNASTRFLICASETTRRSIMSDSRNRLGMSWRSEKARRASASPVDTVRQLLTEWKTTPSR